MIPKFYLRVFLASPGDVSDERAIALKVLSDLPYDPLLRGKVAIEVVAWDKIGGPPMEANLTPQDAIRKGLPMPSECDIFICIFWGRMGTPLELDGKNYQSGTHYEYEDAFATNKETGKPRILLYRRTEEIPLYFKDPNFEQKLEQQKRVNAFFDKFTERETGRLIGGYNAYETPDKFREILENHLKSIIGDILTKDEETYHSKNRTRARISQEMEDYSTQFEGKWEGSPFPGLRAFMQEDEAIFFGRGRETDNLVEYVRGNKFTAVVGASGSGKSSLVGAGLIPRLIKTTANRQWQPIIFTPDLLGIGDPFASAATALYTYDKTVKIKTATTRLAEDPSALKNILSSMIKSGQENRHFLVFIDQFEELFTTVDPNKRKGFIQLIDANMDSEILSFVVTLRGDFYGQALDYSDLAHLLETGTFPLAAPSISALYEMITRPAFRAELEFEDGLPQRILDETGTEPGALALMAYTLDELYHTGKDDGLLSHEEYDALGGVKGAIGERAESVFSGLEADTQAELPHIFRELVEVDERGTATRRREKLEKVCRNHAGKELVNELTAARLMVQSRGENNVPFVEVAHEALLRSWNRLAEWINDTQDDLRLLRQVRLAAKEWEENGKMDAFLWPHERLKPVYLMQKNLKVDFEPLVADFIAPEIERLEREFNDKTTSSYRKLSIIERYVDIGGSAEFLINILEQGQPERVMRTTIIALGNMKDERAVPALLKMIDPRKFHGAHTIKAAITALGKIGDQRAVKPLIALMKESTELEVARIATALGKIGDERAVPDLIKVLGTSSSWNDAPIKRATVNALGKIKDERSVDALIRMLSYQYRNADRAEKAAVRRGAAVALGNIKSPKAVPHLINSLKDRDENVAKSAAAALKKIGTPEALAAIE